MIEQPLAKYLFWRTPLKTQLVELLETQHGIPAGKARYQDFVTVLKDSDNVALRDQVESLVQGLKTDIETLAALNEADRELANLTWALSPQQQKLIFLYGAKFKLNPLFSMGGPVRRIKNMDPSQGRIQFVPEEAFSVEMQARSKLFVEESVDPTNLPQLMAKTEWDLPRGVREANAFRQRMKDCVKGMPSDASKKQEFRHMLTKLGIAETMTVAGSISAAGSKVMTWDGIQQFLPTLAFDMMMTGYFSMKTSKSSDGRAPFMVRWYKTVITRSQRAVVDAIVFHVFPWKNAGDANLETTLKRFSFNAAWNVGTSVIPVTLYSLLSGLECLNHYAPMTMVSKGVQMAEAGTMSVIYYNGRTSFMANPWVSEQYRDLVRTPDW